MTIQIIYTQNFWQIFAFMEIASALFWDLTHSLWIKQKQFLCFISLLLFMDFYLSFFFFNSLPAFITPPVFWSLTLSVFHIPVYSLWNTFSTFMLRTYCLPSGIFSHLPHSPHPHPHHHSYSEVAYWNIRHDVQRLYRRFAGVRFCLICMYTITV